MKRTDFGSILWQGVATIQERPLLAQVRYLNQSLTISKIARLNKRL